MTATTPTATTAAPTAPTANARCATCAAPFASRNDAQLYCGAAGAACRRFAARASGLRDAADVVLANGDSKGRDRAVFGLRRVLVAAATEGGALPGAAVKVDASAVASRARRWCACCRAELPAGGRGRPAVSCAKATGRPCARLRNRAQELSDLADAIAAAAALAGREGRARRAMLRTVTEINLEIGIFF